MEKNDNERPIASFENEKKKPAPLPVKAPHNPEYSSSFDEETGLPGERNRPGSDQ